MQTIASNKDGQKTSYTTSTTTDKTAEEVFDCLTNRVKDWWSERMEGSAANVGDRFIVRFGGTYKDLEVIEVIKYEKIVWLCKNSHIDMATLSNKSEWNGTHIIWRIEHSGTGCTLHMQHEGLATTLECYDVCDQGWQHFVNSLNQLLATGKGNPSKLSK